MFSGPTRSVIINACLKPLLIIIKNLFEFFYFFVMQKCHAGKIITVAN